LVTPTDSELLDAVKSAMSGTLSRNAQAYTVNGRSLTSLSLSELMKLRDYLEGKVAEAAGDIRPGVVTFRRPC
jgi:hypothetical protein